MLQLLKKSGDTNLDRIHVMQWKQCFSVIRLNEFYLMVRFLPHAVMHQNNHLSVYLQGALFFLHFFFPKAVFVSYCFVKS